MNVRQAILILPIEEPNPDWLRLRRLLYPDDSLEQLETEMRRMVDGSHWRCFQATVGIASYAGMIELSLRDIADECDSSPVGYLESIIVDPRYRGVGVAKLLYEHAEKWFLKQGCMEMATDSFLTDTVAQQFHLEMGCHETSRIVQFRKRLGIKKGR